MNHLEGQDFFVSERSGALPKEITKHYVLHVNGEHIEKMECN